MHLIYFDESGNSGNNLDDSQQPILVVGALIVPEDCWQALESDLERAIEKYLPSFSSSSMEIHGSDLRRGTGPMKGIPVEDRVKLRDAWLGIARIHSLKFVYRSIEKKRYKAWQHDTFGAGVSINPQIAAFALVSLVVNEFLAAQKALGILIIDESKEVVRDVEKSIRHLRLMPGPMKLSQIVEKGFFIDSTKSRVLQLCDLCSLHARKMEEVKLGAESKTIDTKGIEMIVPLLHRGNEQLLKVLDWLKAGQKGGSSK